MGGKQNGGITGIIPEDVCNMNELAGSIGRFNVSGNSICPPYPSCFGTNFNFLYSNQDCDIIRRPRSISDGIDISRGSAKSGILLTDGETTTVEGHTHNFVIHSDNSVTIYNDVNIYDGQISSHNHRYVGKWPNGYITDSKGLYTRRSRKHTHNIKS